MAVELLARELQITYGAVTIGGGSSPGNKRPIHRAIILHKSQDRATLEFSFVTLGHASASDFATEIATLESALRTPRQALAITMAGQAIDTLSHTSGTGIDGTPQIINADDDFSNGRSRRYTVRIEFALQHPINDGRRNATITVDYDASRRRTCTLAGEWTSSGSTSARDQYEANIAAHATAVLDGLGGTWELMPESVTNDDASTASNNLLEGNLVRYRRVYRELIFSQAGQENHAALVNQRLTVRIEENGEDWSPGNTPDGQAVVVVHPKRILVGYAVTIDKDVSQALESLWTGTIKPWIATTVQSRHSLASVAIISSAPEFDYDNNQIAASIEIESGGGGYEKYHLDELAEWIPGDTTEPLLTGKRTDKELFHGPSTLIVTRTETAEQSGRRLILPTILAAGPSGYGDLQWNVLQSRVQRRISTRGTSGYSRDVTIWTRVSVQEGYTQPTPVASVFDLDFINLRLGAGGG